MRTLLNRDTLSKVSRGLVILGVIVVCIALALAWRKRATLLHRPGLTSQRHAAVAIPTANLRDGDLIFQESTSGQSEMVRALTDSRWTHMGAILKRTTGTVVLEAASPVRTTPLARWIAHGRSERFVVKRLHDADDKLSPDVIRKMNNLGATWLGRPYDLRFRWDDETLYCSELAYKLYERAAGIRVGKLQHASEMNLDDELVQRALRKRFANATFDPSELVVTPDSMFNDDQLIEVTP